MKKYVLGIFLASIIAIAGIAIVVKNGNNTAKNSSNQINTTDSKTTNTNSIDTMNSASGIFTSSQIASHNKPSDCWIIVSNNVYNVSNYIDRHPGGAGQITPLCGKDATSAFEGQHGNPNSNSRQAMELANLKIGSVQ